MATTTAHTNTTPARVQMIMIIVCDTGSFGSGVVECCGVGSTVVVVWWLFKQTLKFFVLNSVIEQKCTFWQVSLHFGFKFWLTELN